MSHTNGQGSVLKAALESMPETMGALMREYIDNKDVRSRTQVRLRMKALLDFAGVDTEWPPNPILEKKLAAVLEPAREAAMRDGQALGLMANQQQAPFIVAGGAAGPPPVEEPRTPPRLGIDNSDIAQPS